MVPGHQQTPVGGAQPSAPREPRRAGGSSRTLHTDTSAAPSFSPRSTANVPPNGPHGGSNNLPGRGFEGGGSTRTAHKHRAGRIIAAVLITLLALAAVLSAIFYVWVNGQLQHFDALSDQADDSSQTWLITGSDVRDGTAGTGAVGSVDGERTDTIMLLVKPKKGSSALISIPRDTFVTVNGKDSKINAVAQNFGWKALTSKVEEISGLKVDHFVRIGFGGVKEVVDALGGVELCYDSTVNDVRSGLNWTAGCHTADGDTALAFSRMRYSDPKGDFGRTERQRQVIQAIAKKASSKDTLLNFGKTKKLITAATKAVKVDEKSNPASLLKMALAFRDATGANGISGTVYYTDPNYYPSSGIGSSILMDTDKTLDMFSAIAGGTQKKGTVGGYVQQ